MRYSRFPFLLRELEETSDHSVGFCHGGTVDRFISGGVLLDFGHVFVSDHFEEDLVLLFEAGVGFFEVGLVDDMNRSDEADGKVFFW